MATCKECIHSECCFMQYGKTEALKWQSEHGCKNFKDRSRFVELPCKVGDVLYGIVPWGNGYKIVFVYVEEIILALRRDKNRVAEKGVFDIKIRPKRRKPIDLKDIFFTVEQAEQALKERESGA